LIIFPLLNFHIQSYVHIRNIHTHTHTQAHTHTYIQTSTYTDMKIHIAHTRARTPDPWELNPSILATSHHDYIIGIPEMLVPIGWVAIDVKLFQTHITAPKLNLCTSLEESSFRPYLNLTKVLHLATIISRPCACRCTYCTLTFCFLQITSWFTVSHCTLIISPTFFLPKKVPWISLFALIVNPTLPGLLNLFLPTLASNGTLEITNIINTHLSIRINPKSRNNNFTNKNWKNNLWGLSIS
jgi:hypothetical protein